MKKHLLNSLLASVFMLAGCATTTLYDPEATNTGIRNTHTVSAEEMKNIAYEAIDNAMSNPRFQEILAEFPGCFAYVSAVNETVGQFDRRTGRPI